MLTQTVLTGADSAKLGRYYSEAVDDYYSRDGSACAWQGKGARALGLAGVVDRKRFEELLRGHISDTEQVTHTAHRKAGSETLAKTRLGIDFTFSAPKSVSIQALVGGAAGGLNHEYMAPTGGPSAAPAGGWNNGSHNSQTRSQTMPV